jgi:hypothetical protein
MRSILIYENAGLPSLLRLCTYVKGWPEFIYTVYIWCIYGIFGRETTKIWQGNHQIYGHIRCIYTVLTNLSMCVHVFYAVNGLCLCHLYLSMKACGAEIVYGV